MFAEEVNHNARRGSTARCLPAPADSGTLPASETLDNSATFRRLSILSPSSATRRSLECPLGANPEACALAQLSNLSPSLDVLGNDAYHV